MALQSFTITVGAQVDTNGKNYIAGQVVYIKKLNGTLASIYSDLGGLSPIPQDGFSNVTNADGQFTFYVETGEYNAESGGKVTPITVVGSDYFNSKINEVVLELSKSRGFRVVGDFASGFTYELPNDVGVDGSGNYWIYTDINALPVVVSAGTTPSAPTYTQVTFNDAIGVSYSENGNVDAALRKRAGYYTLAQAQVIDLEEGQCVRFTDFDNGLYQVVLASDTGGFYQSYKTGFKFKLIVEGDTLEFGKAGITINTVGTAHSNFNEYMEYSANFANCTLPNGGVYVDNTTPASFQSGVTYIGGRNTRIIPTIFNQRVFLTQNKTNFNLIDVKSPLINEGVGGEDNYIGGGYWRFENCTEFYMERPNVSRSFGTGIKLVNCGDFEISKPKCQYNQFSGLELEGCSDYVVCDYKLSYNGRYSADNTYKPLPTGWTGTHGGRGVTILAGSNPDQEYSKFINGKAIENSEYNIRVFAANTVGVKNLIFSRFYVKDAGHPAGTYGTVVLGSSKGVDYLVNSDVSGESTNIKTIHCDVERTLPYGTPVSMDGEYHENDNMTVRITDAAKNIVAAYQLFGAKHYTQRNCKSYGANAHIAFGSNNPNTVTIENDKAYDCKRYILGSATGTDNLFKGFYAKHHGTAVSGEIGFTTFGGEFYDGKLDGFFQGVVTPSNPTECVMGGITTVNSVNLGYRDFSDSASQFTLLPCDFDSVSGFDKKVVIHNGRGVRQASISWNAGIPTTGHYAAGSLVYDMTPDAAAGGKRLLGWRRLTTGSAHALNTDWEEMYVDNA